MAENNERKGWHRHINGGGWVQDTAEVAETAYVGSSAQVLENARVYGNARVYDTAQVSGHVRVSGEAQVFGNARAFGDAHVSGTAWVYGTAQVCGTAWVGGNTEMYGDVWETTPLQIQGTRDFLNEPRVGYLRIGCTEKTLADWVENLEAIGKEWHYSNEEILEYTEFIELAIKRQIRRSSK